MNAEPKWQVLRALFWTVGIVAALSVVGVVGNRGIQGMSLPGQVFIFGSILAVPIGIIMAFTRRARWTGIGLLLGWGVSLLLLLSICGAGNFMVKIH